jgi:acyl-CoA synthetase (AMP-forming)/AMP-acid ligase II/acyl carrier protein
VSAPASLADLIRHHADHTPDAVALLAPDRAPTSFAGLAAQLDRVAARLKAAGIGPGHRVAMALPNGADAAVAFLALASHCACAPLNPANLAELDFELRDCKVTALILEKGALPTAREVAERAGVPVFNLIPPTSGGPAGGFELEIHRPSPLAGEVGWGVTRPDAGDNAASPVPPTPTLPGKGGGRIADPEASPIALLLHTSGTTARPKLVPLSAANILASARQIATSYRLGPDDRGLAVMPMFHIHGLIAGVVAPLAAGGSVACPPGFTPDSFFDGLRDFAPTWYTAVPTMHQAILAHAEQRREVVARHRLRFIRSCSAALPPAVMGRLEACFNTPVLEAYGMTEATHQMASAPLPPLARHPGSVGLASGIEIAVLSEGGKVHGAPATGEVVIRGSSVMSGYEDNPTANATAFVEGWFRTGDVGRLDADGTLWLIGRIKEIINRGGEKVSPIEIDQALLTHPAIAEAAAFAVPHETLGEEVAAAVVLRPGKSATEAELKAHVATQLSPYKVPRSIVIWNSLPKGPTGKLRRTELAASLGLAGAPKSAPDAVPFNDVEAKLAAIWARTLGRERCGIDENFFLLGGDSLQAIGLVAEVSEALNVDLRVESIFAEGVTVRGMAALAAKQPPRVTGDRPERLPEPRPVSVPASLAQEGLWILSRLHRGTPIFNVTTAIALQGPLDLAALREALRILVARHEALRSVVKQQDGRLMQWVQPPFALALDPIPVQDEAAAVAALQGFAQQSFDLAAGPLIRARLLRLSAESHLLVLSLHHAVADGWSRAILVRDIAALYAAATGSGADLPPAKLHYADFTAWQRRREAAGAFAASLGFWRERLAGAPRFVLPSDRPVPEFADWRGARWMTELGPDLAGALRDLARSRQVTLFMVLLTGFAMVLHEASRARDLVVAVPVGNRPSRDLEPAIGCFVNLLPLRLAIDGDRSFAALLDTVREATVAALAHQDAPIELILKEWTSNQRSRGDTAIPVQFQLRNFGNPESFAAGPLAMSEIEIDPGIAPADVSVEIAEGASHLACSFTYRTDLFSEGRIAGLAERFVEVLTVAAGKPERRLSEL